MPEPVFRRSDGFTPRAAAGNEDPTITPDSVTTLEVDTRSPDENGQVADAPAIAAQPEFTTEEPVGTSPETTAPPVKKKSGFFRILLIILGLAIVIGGIAVAAALGFIWYFSQVSESQNLN
jgi:hypothetical protein